MFVLLLIALAICVAGLLAELLAGVTAPPGYEDESGFHFGRQPEWDEQSGNPGLAGGKDFEFVHLAGEQNGPPSRPAR